MRCGRSDPLPQGRRRGRRKPETGACGRVPGKPCSDILRKGQNTFGFHTFQPAADVLLLINKPKYFTQASLRKPGRRHGKANLKKIRPSVVLKPFRYQNIRFQCQFQGTPQRPRRPSQSVDGHGFVDQSLFGLRGQRDLEAFGVQLPCQQFQRSLVQRCKAARLIRQAAQRQQQITTSCMSQPGVN